MKTIDLLVIGVIALIVVVDVIYIVRQKKKGVACIGCPSSGSCSKKSCIAFNTKTIEQIRNDIQASKVE